MKVFSLIGAAALMLFVAGCGSDNKPLTAEQKAQVKETLSSATRVVSAGEMARSRKFAAPTQLFSLLTAAQFPSLDTQGPEAQKMAQMLQQGKCQFSGTGLSGETPVAPTPSNPPQNVSLSVKGDDCPIALDLAMTTQMTGNTGFSAKFHATYGVKDAAFKPLNDVVGFNLDGGMAMSSDMSGAGSLTAQMTGAIVSQKYGNIGTDLSAQLSGGPQGGGGEIAFHLKYPSYTAELKVNIEGSQGSQPNIQFQVNGENVTQDEFLSYFKGINPAGMQQSGISPMPMPSQEPSSPANPSQPFLP